MRIIENLFPMWIHHPLHQNVMRIRRYLISTQLNGLFFLIGLTFFNFFQFFIFWFSLKFKNLETLEPTVIYILRTRQNFRMQMAIRSNRKRQNLFKNRPQRIFNKNYKVDIFELTKDKSSDTSSVFNENDSAWYLLIFKFNYDYYVACHFHFTIVST